MKLYYYKILLFYLLLNILVLSSYAHNKNKAYITTHTPTTSSRLLSEKDLQSSIYDNDADMKSVKENFDRRTSQRFEEYDERMNEKRQKSKEQRDKNVQKIILKDKIEKTLAQKVEKGCLMCGCGLGGVAASVGIFGAVAINLWKPGALEAAIKAALEEGAAEILAAGIEAGKEVIIGGLETLNIAELKIATWEPYFTTGYNINVENLATVILSRRDAVCSATSTLPVNRCRQINISIGAIAESDPQPPPGPKPIETVLKGIFERTKEAADLAAETAEKGVAAEITEKETAAINTIFMGKQTAIIASVVAILVIVLVMIIIYLVLRYRRKKKMKKKAQYTKLLNE
ncbi:hypothetical protein PFUGPA_00673 [Plasmodium falciparum Palo Alto/Uganda]|uniref:Rifin n=2 Tax=Plasmodium falciparum TaxID=5833 RepID=W4J4X5_PLAFP|nr:hypothetical protein PFUGPA_00673 [Plasmodium falciparum Palo Alto/Uganda]ETW58197.1 hypothetical protein PFMC_05909 [Plasmodium falciparum CAMP/Malaysia]